MNVSLQIEPSVKVDANALAVINTLCCIAESFSKDQEFVIGYKYVGMDVTSFTYYYLAQKVKIKMLGFIPCTRKKVLVSMYDPSRNYHGMKVSCAILDEAMLDIASRAVRAHADEVKAVECTILRDLQPLVI